MDEKINMSAVEQYSEVYASRLAEPYFARREKISGPDILTLSEIKQINLFVIRDLMITWKQETEKLRSPYFDYQAKEVAESFAEFQNALSNHIAITKDNFIPLLKSAVANTIYLIFDPYDFYSDILERCGKGSLQKELFKNEVKYLRINKGPMERLLEKMEEKNTNSISGNEAFALLDEILEEVNFSPEDVEGYVMELSKFVPLTIERLYEPKAPAVNVRKAEPVPVRQAPVPVITEPKAPEQAPRRKGRIKDNLTINQKFMFTKILFHGDFELFSEAIDRFDNFDDMTQALHYIDVSHPEWDKEGEEYSEFMMILEKRFS